MRKIVTILLITILFISCASKKIGEMEWTLQTTNTQDDITSIYFHDDKHGWACTSAGNVLYSEDGGENWSSSNVSGYSLNAIAAYDKNNVWVAGSNGTLYYSSDAGANFQDRAMEEEITFTDMAFWDEENGILAGHRMETDSSYVGVVFRTADGGSQWSEVYVAMDKVTSLYILGESLAWVGTDGHLWRTENNGADWEDNFIGEGITLFGLYFDDYSSGYLVGDTGTYYTSTDYGWSWSNRGGQFPKRKLNDIDFMDRFGGVIIGDSGLIMISGDGGESWNFNDQFTDSYLHDISIVNNKIWICGSNGTIICIE